MIHLHLLLILAALLIAQRGQPAAAVFVLVSIEDETAAWNDALEAMRAA